ncbi:MAG TPA: hypothetical protein VG650_16055 [Mycobacteriales bacterium]|nr:hypothetical protein [Mycobacteriales bacterium]
MSHYHHHSNNDSVVCHRCATVMLPGATVCTSCCAPLDAVTHQPLVNAVSAPIVAALPEPAAVAAEEQATGEIEGMFGHWPFGGADDETVAQVARNLAASSAAATVRKELTHFSSSQDATHVMPAIPAPRAHRDSAEMHSVPSTGPNPFLAAIRSAGEAADHPQR